MVVMRVSQELLAATRFWSKVEDTAACWLWRASVNADGYGHFGLNGKTEHAHRYAWWLATGETLTSSDAICHTCDVRNCVRNDDVGTYELGGVIYPRRGHLYKATQPANVADRDEKGRGRWATGEQNGTHTHPERRVIGVRNAWAVLTDAGVVAIRTRYAAGESASDLAVEFGLADRTSVFAVLKGKTWSHVPGPSYEEIKAMRRAALGLGNAGPCRDCGTTERRRIAKGLCEHCYKLRDRRARGILPNHGETHHSAKLTDAQVAQIRAETGTTGLALARRYGVSTALISLIRNNQTRV